MPPPSHNRVKKIKIEAKRSLKLTNSKINNPGSLGATPKKKLPSKNAYPILRITKDETDKSKDKCTKEWVTNAQDVTPSAPAEDDEDDPNTRPPNYDQSVQQHQRATQQGHQVHFNPNIVQYVQPSMIHNNEFQYSPQATSQINMSKEWITEQKEKMRQTLKKRGIPRGLWDYYIETPKEWDYDDIDETGIHNGVKNILMVQRNFMPW